MAEYNIPNYDAVDFQLEEYLIPNYDAVDFEIGAGGEDSNLTTTELTFTAYAVQATVTENKWSELDTKTLTFTANGIDTSYTENKTSELTVIPLFITPNAIHSDVSQRIYLPSKNLIFTANNITTSYTVDPSSIKIVNGDFHFTSRGNVVGKLTKEGDLYITGTLYQGVEL